MISVGEKTQIKGMKDALRGDSEYFKRCIFTILWCGVFLVVVLQLNFIGTQNVTQKYIYLLFFCYWFIQCNVMDFDPVRFYLRHLCQRCFSTGLQPDFQPKNQPASQIGGEMQPKFRLTG